MHLLSKSSTQTITTRSLENVDTLPAKRRKTSDSEESIAHEPVSSDDVSRREDKCKIARDRKWELMYQLLMEYEKQNGHCRFPLSFKVSLLCSSLLWN